jgi:hypothetical protein
LSGAGIDGRTVCAINIEGGPRIDAGGFSGDIDGFRAKVRANDDNKILALDRLQYLSFTNLVAAKWCPEKVES